MVLAIKDNGVALLFSEASLWYKIRDNSNEHQMCWTCMIGNPTPLIGAVCLVQAVSELPSTSYLAGPLMEPASGR